MRSHVLLQACFSWSRIVPAKRTMIGWRCCFETAFWFRSSLVKWLHSVEATSNRAYRAVWKRWLYWLAKVWVFWSLLLWEILQFVARWTDDILITTADSRSGVTYSARHHLHHHHHHHHFICSQYTDSMINMTIHEQDRQGYEALQLP